MLFGDTLTVEECAKLARRQAPGLVAATYDQRAAALDSSATSLNRRPGFFVSAGSAVAPEWSYDPTLTNLGEYHAQLGMDLTLADGGRRQRARERSRLGAETARARRRVAYREAGLEAAALALRAGRLGEVGGILREARDRLEGIGALVRSGVSSGVRSPADSIRLSLALEDAALALEAVGADETTTQLELLGAMGLPLERRVFVRDADGEVESGPAIADSLGLSSLVHERPELTLARLQVAAARLEASDAGRRDAATVELGLDAGLAGADVTRAVPLPFLIDHPGATFADRLKRDLGASATLRFRLPLLDRALAPALASHDAAILAATTRSAAAEREEQRRVLELVARWRSATERVRLAESIAIRAETHFLRTKSLYAGGATTLFDVLDALQLLRDARVRRAESREDLRMVRFEAEDRR